MPFFFGAAARNFMKTCKFLMAVWIIFALLVTGYIVYDGALRTAYDKGTLQETYIILTLFVLAPPLIILLATKIIFTVKNYHKS